MATGQQAYIWVSTNVVFVLLMFQTSYALGFKTGKINVTAEKPGLFACEAVLFDAPFQGVREVRVFVSVSHAVEGVSPQKGAAVWVELVNARGFTVCLLEFAEGSNGTTQIDWIAVEEATLGITLGTVSLDSWSAGTKCKRVDFSQRFSMIPFVFVTAHHQVLRRPRDSMALWVEDVHERNFKVCLREAKIFDGRHEDIKVEWLAFTSPPENFTRVDSIVFTSSQSMLPGYNSAICKTINFSNPFYATPTVIATPQLNLSDSSASTGCNAVTAWAEYTTENRTTLCVRSYNNDAVSEGNIKLDYAVIGDLHPCLGVNCSYYAVCKALGPKDFLCLCPDECPSYQEPVCSSNGTTYDNNCFYKREVCEHRHNLSLHHPGSCEGFPFQRGRREIKSIPSRSDSYCEVIQFRPYVFYPDKAILVQITANHIDTADQSYIHDAVVSWVESVGYDSFTACVMVAGMREREWFSNVTIDWMAFQGAPVGGVSGEVHITRWWTGTTCETVNFPMGKFSVTPSVFVTSEHHIPGVKRDAASVWVEDVTQYSFKVCLRELQNYAGIHEDININWLAFFELYEPLFSEHDSIYFLNGQPPPPGNNDAYCKDVTFRKSYTTIPTVFVTANHSSSGLNLDPVYNGICAWIEYMNVTGFRTCFKELYETRYDPVSITFTVLPDICDPGWSYYGGYCYFKSSACTSWLTAEANCTAVNSSLVTVHNQEENVYIQHRHNGEKSWIGLNDRSVEGSFVWTNREMSSFRFWATNQPNNFRDSDCVHTLGVAHEYKWNDVPCSDCHNFTCAKDYDECATHSDNCHVNADCHNTVGSYSCSCRAGYTGNGLICTDYDECATGSNNCNVNAQCHNAVGSYSCSCRAGYTGNGLICTDYDECATGSNNCNVNAQCHNTVGSYSCSCRTGYTGNGLICTDYNECATGSNNCNVNAQCHNTVGSYSCSCRTGYTGNGLICTDYDECATGSNNCNVKAQCHNTVGSYSCSCRTGYTGNGVTCTDLGPWPWPWYPDHEW